MKIYGITGGIASGKTNVCNTIRSLGYDVLDCDLIARELRMKGNSLYNAIIDTFGIDYLDNDGNIDKDKLGRLIFNNKDKRELLDKISHPLILDELTSRLNKLNKEIAFIEVPLLFEAGFNKICDKIICIYLPREVQIKRLMERDKIDKGFAEAKINSQMSLDKKKELSDYIIVSDDDFNITKKRVIELINKIA